MKHFGTTASGQEVHSVILESGDLTVELLTLGARLHDVRLRGADHSLTLAAQNVADYENPEKAIYHGAIVGPIANRIGNARVRLDGMMYELERNEAGTRHLHSGSDGMHAQVWSVTDHTENGVTMSLSLPDGMAGLPGHRTITAHFTITPPATLTLTLIGITDATTLMNIANHSYWNMDGSARWDGHRLRVAADHVLPIDDATCPTGEVADVTGTDMDFRTGVLLGTDTPPLDHNFCLSPEPAPLRDVLSLTGTSGVSMAMATTEPGMQVFDGRPRYQALALEAQHWPDAPNNHGFPSITLRPGETYRQTTQWRFARD